MDRTITALYDTKEEAEQAKRTIQDRLGGGSAHIEITSAGRGDGGASSLDSGQREEGFMEKVKHFFMADEDRPAYSEGLRRGGHLLTARVDEAEADEVCRLLHDSGAVDLDARQQEWAASGWERGRSGASSGSAERIPIAEERFKVGKREVDRGTVRVRSYVEERPVHEQIDLNEERVEVDRRPVDRPISGAQADGLFRERTIEMTERGEEAVVAKEAVVTEEIGLRKESDRRTETIDDTVRKTRVDVDDGRESAGAGRSERGVRNPSEERTFASPEDHSVAMDPDGERARETEEERQRRLRDEPGGRPIPL